MFELCGLLIALALYNGITLPVSFPKTFYLMLSRSFSTIMRDPIEAIADGWPILAKSLSDLEKSGDLGLQGVFHMEANGLSFAFRAPLDEKESPPELQVVEVAPDVDISNIAWPGWRFNRTEAEPVEIDASNKTKYVQQYAGCT